MPSRKGSGSGLAVGSDSHLRSFLSVLRSASHIWGHRIEHHIAGRPVPTTEVEPQDQIRPGPNKTLSDLNPTFARVGVRVRVYAMHMHQVRTCTNTIGCVYVYIHICICMYIRMYVSMHV